MARGVDGSDVLVEVGPLPTRDGEGLCPRGRVAVVIPPVRDRALNLGSSVAARPGRVRGERQISV